MEVNLQTLSPGVSGKSHYHYGARNRCLQLATVQTKQDLACCAEKFPSLKCRPISAQFMRADRIGLFELTLELEKKFGSLRKGTISLFPRIRLPRPI